MSFNELNSVEHFIIHRLTGANLNNVRAGMVAETHAVTCLPQPPDAARTANRHIE